MIGDNSALVGLRQDEIRKKVQAYFKAQLDQYLDWLDKRALSKNALADAREEMLDHDCMVDLEGLNTEFLPIARFKRKMDVSDDVWDSSQPRMTIELRKGRRDMLRRILEAAERLEHYSYDDAPAISHAPPAPALPASSPLGAAVEDFIAEHSRQWAVKTIGQNLAYLNILVEYFGPERLLGTITKLDASEVKKVLQALPASRNTKPALKALPLMQVIKEPGHKKIAPKTINSHIQMFKMFFDWAETHGYSPHTLFDGKMKVANLRSRLQPYRAHLLRRHQLYRDQILNLSIGDMTAHGMALMDPAGEPRTAFGFSLTSLFAVGLYLGNPLLPPAHLEPVVREADLAACVALAFLRISFDRLRQVIGLHTGFHGGCDQAQTRSPVSDPVFGIGR
jgi:hypothetical protein